MAAAAIAATAGTPVVVSVVSPVVPPVHSPAVVTHAAPGLQRVLNEALAAGGWFGEAHEQQVASAALESDEQARLSRVRSLLADETRLGMLVGVAVGFELAHELSSRRED